MCAGQPSQPINYSPGHWKMTDSIDRPATSMPVNPVDWPATSGLTQLTGQPINYSTGQSKTTDSQGTFHLSRSPPKHLNLHTRHWNLHRALESLLSGSPCILCIPPSCSPCSKAASQSPAHLSIQIITPTGHGCHTQSVSTFSMTLLRTGLLGLPPHRSERINTQFDSAAFDTRGHE